MAVSMAVHQALFRHRAIDAMHTFPLIAVIDGDFAHLAHRIEPPQITAHISGSEEALQLSFMIEKTAASAYLQAQSGELKPIRADYLWQKDCFECFIQRVDETAYLEVNANLTGEFNIYQFDAYRTPPTMPPVASQDYALQSFVDSDDHHLYFAVEISPLFEQGLQTQWLAQGLTVNPTAILYPIIDGEAVPVYYAHQHATPPDFHHAAYWQRLDYRTAEE